MINYKYRQLSGFYKGQSSTSFADYNKINNGMLELSKDLPSLDSRIGLLEGSVSGILTNANFLPGTINGNIITPGTINGSVIEAGTITGSQIITNSLTGITDANIAANANINPSKINLALISHTQLKDIGSNTHPQIDQDLTQLFADIGDTPGVGLPIPLQTQITGFTSSLATVTGNLQTLTNYVDPISLSTTSQQVGPAINELALGLTAVAGSGFGIVGPLTVPQYSVATWGLDNKHLNASSAFIDGNGNISTPGNIYFFNSGNPTIGTPLNGAGTIYLDGLLQFNAAGTINGTLNRSISVITSGNASVNLQTNNASLSVGNSISTITVPSGLTVNGPSNFSTNVTSAGTIQSQSVGTVTNPIPTGYFSNIFADTIIQVSGNGSSYVFPTNTAGPYMAFPSGAGFVNFVVPQVSSGTSSGLQLNDGLYNYLAISPAASGSPNALIFSSGSINVIADNALNINSSSVTATAPGGFSFISGSSNFSIAAISTLITGNTFGVSTNSGGNITLGSPSYPGSILLTGNNPFLANSTGAIIINTSGTTQWVYENANSHNPGINFLTIQSQDTQTSLTANALIYCSGTLTIDGSTGLNLNSDTGTIEIAASTILTSGAPLQAYGGVQPGQLNNLGFTNASNLFSGSGVPNNTYGSNGNFYFRSDTPGTSNQRIYVKSAGSWVGIV